MTTTPPQAPPPAPAPAPAPAPPDSGPRVDRDEIRDLARLRRSREDRKIAGVAGGIARHLDIDPVIPRVLLAVLVLFGGAGLLLYAVIWLIVPVEGTEESTVRLDDRSRSVALVVTGGLAALALIGDSLGGWGPPWPLVVAGTVILVVLTFRGRESGVTTDATTDAGSAPTPTDVKAPRRRGPVLFWYAWAITAIGAGALGMVDLAGADVPSSAYPAIALGTCAVLLVLGAFWGRAGGLILLGLVATVATAGAMVADEIDAGTIDAAPTSAAALEDRYTLAVGEISLDLTEVVDPEALDGRTVEVELDVAGRIEITVPQGLDVVVESRIEIGDRRVLGETLSDDGVRTTTVDGGVDAPELTLDVRTAFGEIEINREGDAR